MHCSPRSTHLVRFGRGQHDTGHLVHPASRLCLGALIKRHFTPVHTLPSRVSTDETAVQVGMVQTRELEVRRRGEAGRERLVELLKDYFGASAGQDLDF